jgi:hypothetical protein
MTRRQFIDAFVRLHFKTNVIDATQESIKNKVPLYDSGYAAIGYGMEM